VNSKKIYVSDLDGTLLRNDATLAPQTKDKLNELLAADVKFSVASARSAISIRQILDGVNLKLPIIELNGSYISEFATARHLVVNDMDDNLVENLFRVIREYNCMPFISAFDGQRDILYYQTIANEGMQWFYDNRVQCRDKTLTHIANLKKAFKHKIVAMTAISTLTQLTNLTTILQQEFSEQLTMHLFENPYFPESYWLSIHDKKACKSHAVKELVQIAGCALDDLTVFGNELNDLPMFKIAATSIAVENATPQLKKHATKIIPPNENNSVANYIENDINK
jgi:Cof subfamily protein (haloacid dehalogenase superfamily)